MTKLNIPLRLETDEARMIFVRPEWGRGRRREHAVARRRGRRCALSLPPAMISAAIACGVVVLVFCIEAGFARAGEDEAPAGAGGTVSVLELFTSQGCSSCPAADKLLERFAERKDVIALSLPVGYWDYLGWKDTFAQPGYTDRQRRYSEEWGKQVFTPELVVNGLVGVVGSDKKEIERAIDASRQTIGGSRAPVEVLQQGNDLVVNLGAAPSGAAYRSGVVWIAWLTRRMAVDVKKGENKGRRLSYFNVVREMKPVAAWDGAPSSFKVSKGQVVERGYDTFVVLVQSGEGGPILGAAQTVVRPDEAIERD